VNHNGLSHPNKDQPILSVVESGEPILTRAWDYSNYDDPSIVDKRATLDLFIEHAVGGHKDYSNYEHGPASNIYVPVFDSYGDDAVVVGVLSSFLDWHDFFEDILLKDDVGVVVVLENTCDQQFTYRLDGYNARYMGAGDLHDTTYDHLKIVIDLGKFVEFEGDRNDLPEGQCLYHANVYSSADNEDQMVTSEPMIFSIVVACTFVFTCSIFLLYDYVVERRQRLVLNTAVRSETMMASLFPKGIRDRLYKEDTEAKDAKKNQSKNAFLASATPAAGSDDRLEDGCKAIADLYPNCTVLFMDIVGFTSWSSKREPWQVFKLLETMYKTFDKIAKRLEVFKVETIGDCYVAVTGIPNPQSDHAVIMTRFATECVLRLSRILSHLVISLGPDTETLRLRAGMHSGPVTAGVLRGAKARFQLFGDTVNTAARMESTGAASKIQLSSDTANLIMAADKTHWIRKRKEEVMAKGKGTLQTYWLEATAVECSRAGSFANGESSNNISY
jgi:class 3 adenylate cyclase